MHTVCVCVCVLACIYINPSPVCVCVCSYIPKCWVYVHIWVCACAYACKHLHVCMCVGAFVWVCVTACGYVHACACIYACKCLCVCWASDCVCACWHVGMYICLYACSCHMPLCSYIYIRVWVGVWAFKCVWICAHYLHDQYGQSCVCGCQCPWPHHSSPLYGCEGCPDLVLTEAKRRNHTKSLSHAWQHCKKKHPIFSSTQIISKHVLSSLRKLFQGEITWSCLVVLESISG